MTRSIYLHLSAAQGPVECELAVNMCFDKIVLAADKSKVSVELIEEVESDYANARKSILLRLEGEQAENFANQWNGTIQWQFISPVRKKYPRKNWFIGCYKLVLSEIALNPDEIRIETMRSQGAGGQHVNKTESAVRITHLATGISVSCQHQRSQHANRKEALRLLAYRLEQHKADNAKAQNQKIWQQHYQLEMGNPIKVFKI